MQGSGSSGPGTSAHVEVWLGPLKGAGPFCRAGSNVKGDRLPVRGSGCPPRASGGAHGGRVSGWPCVCRLSLPRVGVSLRQVRYRGGLPASRPAEATATLDRANRTSPPNCLPRGLTVKCVFSWPRGDARTLTCPCGLQAGLTGSDGGPRGPWDFCQPRERDVHHRLLHPGRTRVRACTGVCVCERTHGCTRCVRP